MFSSFEQGDLLVGSESSDKFDPRLLLGYRALLQSPTLFSCCVLCNWGMAPSPGRPQKAARNRTNSIAYIRSKSRGVSRFRRASLLSEFFRGFALPCFPTPRHFTGPFICPYTSIQPITQKTPASGIPKPPLRLPPLSFLLQKRITDKQTDNKLCPQTIPRSFGCLGT